MVTGAFFYASPIPGLFKVFELGIDRANEAPGKNRSGAGSVVEKLRTAWVRQAPPGSFGSAPPSTLSRDESVWRSAQDDDLW